MTAAVTLLAKERGGPRIGFQVLFYPVTDANFDTPTYREFPTGHFLTREAMKWFWNQYLPDEAAPRPTASPLQASVEQLKGLPPGANHQRRVRRAAPRGRGLCAQADRSRRARHRRAVPRHEHGFVLLNVIADTPAARGAIAMACDHLRRVFAT